MIRPIALAAILAFSSCQCGPGGVTVMEPRRDAGASGGTAGGAAAGGNTTAGGSAAGGSAAGGSAAGGSAAGGSAAGGSAAGGSTAGGSAAGGSAAGGSAAGGSAAGGSAAGGSAAGGSAAGGSAAGGSAAGGSAAGGSAAGGSTSGGSADAGFVEVVYGHSADTLYALDPVTKAVRRVGSFSCAFDITDLAIDGQGNAFIVGFSGFYRLDLTNAACTPINTVLTYPNSLSFVPRGTLDPTAEVLVAYSGRFYNRINTTTGAMQQIGSLPMDFESSGDIVSVQDGGTFLTVKNMYSNPMCDDCLLQVNPVTGGLIRNYGPIPYTNVYGIAYWGGSVYGFTQAGQLFEIGPNGTGIITRPITIPSAPPGLSFNGAGSSTAVPVVSRDGGGISID